MTSINRDEWLKALDDAGVTQEDDQEAVTVSEFAKAFGLHRCTAERQLLTLVQSGKAIKTRKSCRHANGQRGNHVAYRLLTEPRTCRKRR